MLHYDIVLLEEKPPHGIEMARNEANILLAKRCGCHGTGTTLLKWPAMKYRSKGCFIASTFVWTSLWKSICFSITFLNSSARFRFDERSFMATSDRGIISI